MDDLIDFEALIDLKGWIQTMNDKMDQSTDQESSQEPLENVLDKMCESLDTNIINLNSGSIDEGGLNETVVNLDEFNMIFDETSASKDDINTSKNKHVNGEENENKISLNPCSLTYLNDFTDIISDTDVQFVDNKENINVEKDDEVGVGDGTDLKQFEEIFNETFAHNGDLASFTKLDLNVNIQALNSCYEPKLDEMEEIVNITETGAIFKDDNKYQIDSHNQNVNQYKLSVTPILEVSHAFNDLEQKENLASFNLNEVKVEFDLNHKHDFKDTDVMPIRSEEPFVLEYCGGDETDGYNSSDFEFISEAEAQNDGLFFKSKLNIQDLANPVQKATKPTMNSEKISNLIINDPNHDYIKYHRNRYLPCRCSEAVARRKTHALPEGESFLDLFRGIYSPIVMNNLYYMSNKNVLPPKSMSVTDGFGFDLPRHVPESAETEAEAAETLKKIRFLYPNENRKRRRRF